MTNNRRLRQPTLDEIVRRIERLEGIVAGLQVDRTRRSLQPTWRDIEPMQKDLKRLKEKLDVDDA